MRSVVLIGLLAAAPALGAPPPAAPGGSQAPAPHDGGLLLALGVGAGLPVSYPAARPQALVPLTLGLGWRFRGGYGVAAVLEPASGDIRDLLRALDPSEPTASGCGEEGCGFRLVLGLEVTRTFDRTPGSPWIGLLLGLEGLGVDRQVAGGPETEWWYGGLVRITVGVPIMQHRSLQLGGFVAAELGYWTDHELETGDATTALAVSRPWHGAGLLGFRVAWLP